MSAVLTIFTPFSGGVFGWVPKCHSQSVRPHVPSSTTSQLSGTRPISVSLLGFAVNPFGKEIGAEASFSVRWQVPVAAVAARSPAAPHANTDNLSLLEKGWNGDLEVFEIALLDNRKSGPIGGPPQDTCTVAVEAVVNEIERRRSYRESQIDLLVGC